MVHNVTMVAVSGVLFNVGTVGCWTSEGRVGCGLGGSQVCKSNTLRAIRSYSISEGAQ